MKSLVTHIEYLLMTQHYCFVPGLGGFMLKEQDAIVKADGTILSPTRIVQFNRFISHDDGMLAGSIMQSRQLSYDEAVASIQVDVANILSKAQHEGRCQMGHLGLMFFDADCHIAFRPADIQQVDPVNYGLENLKLKPWAQAEEKPSQASETIAVEEKKEAPIVELKPAAREGVVSIPTRWIRRVAIVLLIIGLFFASRMPLTDNSIQQASMLSAPTFEASNAQTESEDAVCEVAASVQEPGITEAAVESGTQVTEAPVEAVEAPVQSQEMASAVAEVPTPTQEIPTQASSEYASMLQANELGLVYYIIIGSCTSAEDAQTFITRRESKGDSGLGYIECDGRFRIFYTYLGKLADAQSYLRNLRTIKGFEKAWIHQAPLSLIIKNKDNDHLSMELSHLNKSAERDKG